MLITRLLRGFLRDEESAEGSGGAGKSSENADGGFIKDQKDSGDPAAAESGMLAGLRSFREKSDADGSSNEQREDSGSTDKGDASEPTAEEIRAKAEADLDFDLDYEGILGATRDGDSDDDGSGEKETVDGEDKKDSEETGESDNSTDEVDVDKLLTSDGKPISTEAKEAFTVIKTKLSEVTAQLTEKENELKNSKPLEEYNKLEEDYKKLQDQLDIIDFTKSKDFTGKYQAPVDAAVKEAVAWLKHIPAESSNSAKAILNSANGALDSGNEAAFFDAVDEMTDAHLTGSKGGRFATSMTALWNANQAKIAAQDNAIEARKGILEDRQKLAKSSEKIIDTTISSAQSTLEQQNKAVFEFYRSDSVRDQFKFDEAMTEGAKQSKDLLNQFLATGNVPSQLTELLVNGSLSSVRDKEREMVMASLGNYQKKLAITQKENEALQSKLKKLTTKRGSLSDSGAEETQEESEEPEYGLLSGLKKLRNA